MYLLAMPLNSTASGLPRGHAKNDGFKDPENLVKKARTKLLVLDVLCAICSCEFLLLESGSSFFDH